MSVAISLRSRLSIVPVTTKVLPARQPGAPTGSRLHPAFGGASDFLPGYQPPVTDLASGGPACAPAAEGSALGSALALALAAGGGEALGGEALGLAALAAGSALLEGSAFAVSAAFGSAFGSAFTAAFAGEAFGSALAALGAGAGSGLTAAACACGAGAGDARSGVLDSSLRLDAPELLPSEKNASGEMLSFLAGALTGAGTAVCGGLSAFLRSGVAPAEPSAFRFLPDCSGSDGLLSAGAGAGFEAAGALGLPKNARISMSNRWLARQRCDACK
mmetsp:Transcript_5271/g.13010  ORF Transcript_5271/g.13010 Transcript_5271/m.13010 type:complete len:275 (-) Transcript_5271:54-878(-)